MSDHFIQSGPIDTAVLRARLTDPGTGAVVIFEGVVRDNHEGRSVTGLDYEAHATLAELQWQRLRGDAIERFELQSVAGAHRAGSLPVGGLAVWIGVSAAHRQAAFEGCAWLIDRVKQEIPIWKRERYSEGAARWHHEVVRKATIPY